MAAYLEFTLKVSREALTNSMSGKGLPRTGRILRSSDSLLPRTAPQELEHEVSTDTIHGHACDDVFASCPDNWMYLYHSHEASLQDSTIEWFIVNIAVHPDLVLCCAFAHRIMQEQSSESSVSDRDFWSTQAVIWSLVRCSPCHHRAYLILHSSCPRSVTQGNQYSR